MTSWLLGASVTEVRITRLAETVFYAAIVVDGPAGAREIDARPSDAVNLALVTGAPVRVDADLLGDPRATDHPLRTGYPTGTAELATEVRQQLLQTTRPCEHPNDQDVGS